MKTRLLLIDDEIVTLRNTKMMLDQHRDALKTSTITTEDLSILTMGDVDLILLDISMPTIDGFDFIKLMSSLRIQVPVVFLSNTDDEYTLKMASAEGVKRCISKNKQFIEIPSIIQDVLTEKRA